MLHQNITKIEKYKNVMFDTKIKKLIIVRYYFDPISTFRYTSIQFFSKENNSKDHEDNLTDYFKPP